MLCIQSHLLFCVVVIWRFVIGRVGFWFVLLSVVLVIVFAEVLCVCVPGGFGGVDELFVIIINKQNS